MQERGELVGQTIAEVFWPRVALATFQSVVFDVVARYAVPSPWKAARSQDVDEHERERFQIVSP